MDTRTLCLGVLSLGDHSGYDIKKRFDETFRYFMDVSHAAIYPALRGLLRDGHVTCTTVQQNGKPNRKVYSLTDSGAQALRKALVALPPQHKVRSDFMALIFFGHLLPAEKVHETLGAQLEEFEELIRVTEDWFATDEARYAPPGMRFTAGYGLAVMRASCAYIRENRHLLSDDTNDARDEAWRSSTQPTGF